MKPDAEEPRSPGPDPDKRRSTRRPATPAEDALPPRAPAPRDSVFRPVTGQSEPDRPAKKVRRPAMADPDALPPRGPAPDRNAFQSAEDEAAEQNGPAGARSGRKRPIAAEGGPTWIERLVFGSVSSHHLSMFCRQFASYSDSGVDLLRSLEGLRTQFSRTALGPVIGRIQDAVRSGDALSEAMDREPQAFDKLFLSMMRVAEMRGGVPETLRMMADHYEARVRMLRQARSAMIYPAIVLLIAFCVMWLLTVFVLPKFADLLKDLVGRGAGAELPLPSRILMGISGFMTSQGWWLMPLLAFGSLFALFRFYATKAGKAMFDEIALNLPVLGALLRKIDISRFARALSVLIESGVDIDASLRLTADIMRMNPYKKAVRLARTLVVEGSELSEALVASRRFPRDVIAIISSGEESGRLPLSLEKLADDYEEQVEYTIKNLGQLVQPILMVLMGLMVLFIILAVFLPIISSIYKLAG